MRILVTTLALVLTVLSARVRVQPPAAQPPPGQPPAAQPPPMQPPTAGQPPQGGQPPAGAADQSVVFVGAGDIANCEVAGGGGARATAALLDNIEGTIFTLGDNAYESGSEKEFRDCFGPTWGRHKARTRPTLGNHDTIAENGKYYYQYFGENAGEKGKGYYSFDLGAWHIISLNSVKTSAGQTKWLKEDLATHPVDCVLAYWHVARFSSGSHGSDPIMSDVWKILYEAGADIVLSSHDHDYERFAPQDYKGKADPEHGIRQFIVGTGGGGVYEWKFKASNSEVKDNTTYGVLKLTLSPGRYAWQFIPMTGKTFHDEGTGVCHAGTPPK